MFKLRYKCKALNLNFSRFIAGNNTFALSALLRSVYLYYYYVT